MPLVVGEDAIQGLHLKVQPGRIPWNAAEMSVKVQTPKLCLRIGNYETIFLVGCGPNTGSVGVYLWTTIQCLVEQHDDDQMHSEDDLTTPKFFIFGGWKADQNTYHFEPSAPWPAQPMYYCDVDRYETLGHSFVNPILENITKYQYIVSRMEGVWYTHRVDAEEYHPFWLAITDDAKVFAPER